MELLAPSTHPCFYVNMASGHCGWLTSEQIIEAMSEALEYETLELKSQPDMDKFGKRWYGFRLCATTEEAPEQEVMFHGQKRILTKRWFDQKDCQYYFSCLRTRDTVVDYLNDPYER